MTDRTEKGAFNSGSEIRVETLFQDRYIKGNIVNSMIILLLLSILLTYDLNCRPRLPYVQALFAVVLNIPNSIIDHRKPSLTIVFRPILTQISHEFVNAVINMVASLYV